MKNEAKHTPGPWLTNHAADIQIFTAEPCAGAGEEGPYDTKMLAHVFNHGDWDEAQANARLIAAAPELLAFAVAFSKHPFPAGVFASQAGKALIGQAMEAIARAEGRA